MRMLIKLCAFLSGVALFCSGTLTYAGGIQVRQDTVTFVESRNIAEPRSRITVRFLANEYVYGAQQYAYVAWAVIPDKASMNPTKAELDTWDIYGILSGTPEREIGLEQAASPYVLTFKAPEKAGKYKIVLSGIPFFRNSALKTAAGYKEAFIPHTSDRRELATAINAYPGALQMVARFEVSTSPIVKDESPPVYLRMNDAVPSEAKTPGGLQDKPIRFSWSVGKEFKKDPKKVLFRYRLEPDDDDWSAWTPMKGVSYSFLLKGVHQFRVQGMYRDGDLKLESQPAMYQFTLPRHHVSRPTSESLTKAPFGTLPQGREPIAFGEVYAKSRALVIAMWKFEDTEHFPQFDEKKISNDVAVMESALRKNGFEVTTLTRERVSREDITAALGALVESSGRDDRVFVYFSTHGFADPVLPSEGYLATTNCKLTKPTENCLRLNDLQTHADRALEGKRVRQVLFAVDSCFSGLGIVRKAVSVTNLTQLAVPQGAFMLTAGMANQLAQIDPILGGSTFTHYLAEGLRGKADILGNNGLITLSELFVYVQHKVAAQTDGQQIPMLGRIKGNGEMLFLPNAN